VTHQHITLPRLTATLVADCVVAAEPAAAFGYSEGNYRGYWLLIVHHERLLGVHLFGAGGVSDQALQDALGMIGSITWTFEFAFDAASGVLMKAIPSLSNTPSGPPPCL
jgi:hypothetical protein